jgi:hypothetical protein
VKQIRKRLTYANVMSSIAVFLVVGGATALAASGLEKNSVGTKQLKNNAVTTAKIKNESITNAKIKKGTIAGSSLNLATIGTVPSATNAGHASSADTATSATSSSSAASAASPVTLASGKTETGVFYGIETVGTGNTGYIGAVISYPFPLASPPIQNYMPIGASPNAACPGTAANPKAAPGNLCAYETVNGTGSAAFFDGSVESSISKFGSGIAAFMNGGTGNEDLIGSWAVTAP